MNLTMYAPVEQAILAEYFALDLQAEDDELDLWQPDPKQPAAIHLERDYEGGRDHNRALANAVARIVLARVQRLLPQFAIVFPDRVEFGRTVDKVPSRPVELLSHHLFTIDWAMTAPGISWPEAYYLTWLPGVEQWLVTSSWDTPEVGGYCDLAIGYFGPDKAPEEGSEMVIGDYWRGQFLDYDQSRWEVFFEAGMIGREEANAWAEEVWSVSEGSEPYDGLDTLEAI
jgi:hypothetical protein